MKDQPVKSKSARRINVQEAARDIRSGMDDSALADKYRLTTKGLASLYDKLLSLGVITQMDVDRRRLGMEDDTIDFREMSLDLSDALTQLGFNSTASSAVEIETESSQSSANPIVKDTKENEIAGSGTKADRASQRESRDVGQLKDSWYNKPLILILLLLGFFPLGFVWPTPNPKNYRINQSPHVSSLVRSRSCLGPRILWKNLGVRSLKFRRHYFGDEAAYTEMWAYRRFRTQGP